MTMLIRPLAPQTTSPHIVRGLSRVRPMSSATSEANGGKIPLRLMPLGGSITYGLGSTDGNGYRKTLQDLLAGQGYSVEMVGSRKCGSMVNNANEGWPGRRIDQIHARATRATAKFLPNIFTVNAGSNDCIQDFGIDSAGARIDAMLEELWAVGVPDATVILSTLVVAADATVNGRVLRVNEQIRELVERKRLSEGKRVVLADMYSSAGGPDAAELVDDGVHPNDEGYIKMAKIWAQSIEEAAGQGMLEVARVYSTLTM